MRLTKLVSLVCITAITAGLPVGFPAHAKGPVEEASVTVGSTYVQENCWSGLNATMKIRLQLKTGATWTNVATGKPRKDAGQCSEKKFPWYVSMTYTPPAAGVYQLRIKGPRINYGPIELAVTGSAAPPTTLPTNPTTPVADLNAFVTRYGNSVVSVVDCDGFETSGVVIPVSMTPELVNAGMKSTVVTTFGGVSDCLEGSWLERRVTVRANGVAYPAYVWGWDETKDIASLKTIAALPAVESFTGSVVRRPRTGDAAVLIWGQAGPAGKASQGLVVLPGADYIRADTRGPGESAAGAALFNNQGQFLGMATSDVFVTGGYPVMLFLPIIRFCDTPYSIDCYIGWAS